MTRLVRISDSAAVDADLVVAVKESGEVGTNTVVYTVGQSNLQQIYTSYSIGTLIDIINGTEEQEELQEQEEGDIE